MNYSERYWRALQPQRASESLFHRGVAKLPFSQVLQSHSNTSVRKPTYYLLNTYPGCSGRTNAQNHICGNLENGFK